MASFPAGQRIPFDICPDKMTTICCADLLRAAPAHGVVLQHKMRGIGIYTLNNVLCLGDVFQALCPQGDDGTYAHLLKESWTYDIPVLSRTVTGALVRTQGEAVVVEEAAPLFHVWSNNFWHWLFEGLARVAMLETIGFTGKYIIPAVPFAAQFMEMLQIDPQRLLLGTRSYFIKNAIVTEHVTPDVHDPKTLMMLKNLHWRLQQNIPKLPGKKRCYISRKGARKVSNESDVIAMLEPMGFEVMVPEEHPSISAELRYMTNVECSIMPHGANCALAFVQPRGAHFFELFGSNYVNPCNGPLVQAAGVQYHQLTAKSDELLAFNPAADYEVNVDLLRYMVRSALRL